MTDDVAAAVARVRATGSGLETRLHDRSRNVVGLRVVDRLGWTRLLRAFAAVLWIGALLQSIVVFRGDLLHPADIGSDSSNYVGAAERLAVGHPLYALTAGDRPAPLDNAPEWTVPTLSPPTTAAEFLWVGILPDGARPYVTWAVGLAATTALGVFVAAVAPAWFLLVFIYFTSGLAITAWSGNVNAWVGPVLAIAFGCMRSRSPRLEAAAGILIAVAICAKIGPAFVGLWLVCQGRRVATAALVATGLVIAGITAVLAGLPAFLEYVRVARGAGSAPGPLSIPGLAHSLGLSGTIADLSWPAALALTAVGVVLLRRRPVSFVLAVIGTIFATTVVRFESIAIIAAAGVAWLATSAVAPVERARPARSAPLRNARAVSVAIGVAVSLASVAASVATGGLTRSSVAIVNETDQAIIARFSVPAQDASFGFGVPARSTIAAWTDLGAGSPRGVSIWTPSCEFVAEAPLPRAGSVVQLKAGVVRLGAGAPGGSPIAAYVPACTTEFKARAMAIRQAALP